MLLITQQEVIEYAFSPTDTLTPDAIRLAKILVAQEHFIRPRLGDALFIKLMDKHREFVDGYLKAPLSHYIRYGVLSDISFHIGDNGISLFDSTNNEDKYTLQRNAKSDKNNESNDLISFDESLTQKGKQTTTDTDMYEKTDSTTTVDSGSKNANQTTTSDDAYEDQLISEERKQYDGYNTAQSVAKNEATDTTTKQVQERGSKIDTITNRNTTDYSQTGSGQTKNDLLSNSEKSNIIVRTDAKEHIDSGSSTSELKDTTSRNTNHRMERAASEAQCRALAQRALYEANILMRCAMRYIEANPREFPEYSSGNTKRQPIF